MPLADFAKFCKTDIVNMHIHFKNLPLIKATKQFLNRLGMYRLGIACLAEPDNTNGNPAGLCFKAAFPYDTYIWGHLDYHNLPGDPQAVKTHLEQQARTLTAAGFDGFKLLETKPTVARELPFAIDDAVYDGFFSFAEEKQLPLIWHAADPDENWIPGEHNREARERGWDYSDGSFPTKEDIYARVERVLERFPRLKVVYAHFYFLSQALPRAGKLLDTYRNVNLDITPGSEMFVGFTKDLPAAREFFIRYQDRILYGDDTSIWDNGVEEQGIREKVYFVRRFLETDEEFVMPKGDMNFLHQEGSFKGLALPETVLRKIYVNNFYRLAGKTPRPLDLKLALEECTRLGNREAAGLVGRT